MCPTTSSFIQSMGTNYDHAFFSAMAPHTHIAKHNGKNYLPDMRTHDFERSCTRYLVVVSLFVCTAKSSSSGLISGSTSTRSKLENDRNDNNQTVLIDIIPKNIHGHLCTGTDIRLLFCLCCRVICMATCFNTKSCMHTVALLSHIEHSSTWQQYRRYHPRVSTMILPT